MKGNVVLLGLIALAAIVLQSLIFFDSTDTLAYGNDTAGPAATAHSSATSPSRKERSLNLAQTSFALAALPKRGPLAVDGRQSRVFKSILQRMREEDRGESFIARELERILTERQKELLRRNERSFPMHRMNDPLHKAFVLGRLASLAGRPPTETRGAPDGWTQGEFRQVSSIVPLFVLGFAHLARNEDTVPTASQAASLMPLMAHYLTSVEIEEQAELLAALTPQQRAWVEFQVRIPDGISREEGDRCLEKLESSIGE